MPSAPTAARCPLPHHNRPSASQSPTTATESKLEKGVSRAAQERERGRRRRSTALAPRVLSSIIRRRRNLDGGAVAWPGRDGVGFELLGRDDAVDLCRAVWRGPRSAQSEGGGEGERQGGDEPVRMVWKAFSTLEASRAEVSML